MGKKKEKRKEEKRRKRALKRLAKLSKSTMEWIRENDARGWPGDRWIDNAFKQRLEEMVKATLDSLFKDVAHPDGTVEPLDLWGEGIFQDNDVDEDEDAVDIPFPDSLRYPPFRYIPPDGELKEMFDDIKRTNSK